MAEKFALITGGSSGIGLEIAKQLALRGYPLLLISNEEERLQQLKSELAALYKVRVEIAYFDLARNEAAKELFDFCKEKGFQIEVLINNAGFFFFGEVVDTDNVKAEKMVQLHVLTTSLLCTLFGREMKKRKRGFILNTCSIAAYKHFPGIAYYGSTKAYIKSFTRSLRHELKYYGVNVTGLFPGATATALYDPTVIDVELGIRLGIMMRAQSVAKKGVQGLFNNKAIIVPGLTTKLMLLFAWFTPHWIIYQIRKRTRWLK